MAEKIGIGFLIGASVSSSLASAFASVESKVKRAQQAIGRAKKESATFQKALDLRSQRDDLLAKYKESGGADKKLNAALSKVSAQYHRAKTAALAYGGSVDDWKKKQAEASRQLEISRASLGRLKNLQDQAALRKDLRGQMVDAIAPTAGIAIPVKLAIDYESAMADVKKVTDFDGAGFKKFSSDLLDMSTRLPIAASGLAEIAAAAGSAGIAEADLLPFTEDAAKMGVAFDISAKEAGAAMTGLRNNFKLSQDGVRLLGDSINALSNSMDAKAAQIVDFANRAGGTAKIYGMTGQEVSALGAAFLDAKVGAEEASTATNAMLVKLGTADKLPKDAQAAFKSLGLSGKGMAKAFKEDAQGALLKLLQTVAASKDPMRALNAIFGAEHAPKIARLVNNLGRYDDALQKVSATENYAGSTEKEYASRAETTANNLQLLQNSMSKVGITLGSVVLPPMNTLLHATIPVVSAFGTWSSQNEGITTTLMGVAAALVALKLGIIVGRYAISGMISTAEGLRGGLSLLGRGMSFLGQGAGRVANLFKITWPQALAPVRSGMAALGHKVSALRGRLASLRAGARGAAASFRTLGAAGIAAGIKAGIAGGMASASRAGWNVLRTGIRGVGAAFRVALGPMSLLMMALSYGADYVIENWDKISPYFTKLWDGVKDIFNSAMEWMQPFFDKIGAAMSFVGDTWNKLFGGDEKSPAVSTTEEKAGASTAKAAAPTAESAAVQKVPPQGAVTPTPSASSPAAAQGRPRTAAATSQEGMGGADSPGVSVSFAFNLNGMPDTAFAQGVIKAIRERSSELESIISGIVNNQARLAYGR